jgi:hypothetical protein
MFITQQKTYKNINQDWTTIRRQIIWAVIVNVSIAGALFVQMYFNQKMIIYRLEKMEANQENIQREILNLYKNDR